MAPVLNFAEADTPFPGSVDMSMNPEDFADVVKSFTPDRITPTRLDMSARRVLNLKNRLGLWEYPNGFEDQMYVSISVFT
jgi:hypothetical protein